MFKFVSFYSIIEFILINTFAEVVKYFAVKYIAKIDAKMAKNQLENADTEMQNAIEIIDENIGTI